MKRLVMIMLCLVLTLSLTACDGLPFLKKEEPEVFVPEQVELTGTVDAINGNTVTIMDDAMEAYNILFETVPDDLHNGTIATFTCNTRELDANYDSLTYVVTYQPLRWVLGYTGEELVSEQKEYNSMLITVKEAIGADATYKGRIAPYSWTRTNVLRNDLYTRQTSTIMSSSLDDISAVDVYESYITKNDTIMKYFNSNYTGWYYDELDEFTTQPDFVFDASTVTVNKFEMGKGNDVVVGFVWDYTKDSNILSGYIKDTMEGFGVTTSNQTVDVEATYDSISKDLLKLTINGTTFDGETKADDLPLSIVSYQLTAYGIEYNTIDELPVPETVVASALDSYYIENPMPITPNFVKEDLLCKSLMGKDQVLVDDIKAWANLNQEITMWRWGADCDELCLAIKNWVNNYNTDTFMHAYVELDNMSDNMEVFAANIIYTWLIPYDVKVADYMPTPTE